MAQTVRRPLVMGNWKMHGNLQENAALLQGLLQAGFSGEEAQVAVCVPAPYLAQAQALLQGSTIHWGAQNLCREPVGAFTGEVSARMLADFACHYVLVGHSERRTLFGESDHDVLQKVGQALQAGLIPVICVGETLAQHDAGTTEAVIAAQLQPLLAGLGAADWARVVVAYEPVWAIGTGKVATPDYAQQVHAFIRAQVAEKAAEAAQGLQILYGGSVKAENAAQLQAMLDIDGALVGGASLKADEFVKICRSFR
ncbi:triose-phosphate isomerase [Leeia sp.]|uniref:triose-phosphate isomerase n=1 Tax=Leeia sp. TaxID=2884678 RepID=UPI0035B0A4F4